MPTGQITVYDTDSGMGIVVDADKAAYEFDPKSGDLGPGDDVTFDIEGDRAVNVKPA